MTISNPDQGATSPRWIREKGVGTLSNDRLARAKPAFTTRGVPFHVRSCDWSGATLISGPIRPRSGDILLARVSRLGHHKRIELVDGRRAHLHVGDEIIVVYGDRYAPDQFEAEIPKGLVSTDLVASGGIAGTVVSRHSSTRRPTALDPIGLIGDEHGVPLNIEDFALRPEKPDKARPRTIAVLGTSMNSGKTTTAASLVLGLRNSGRKPGAAKATGTGSGADYWQLLDSGAHCVADFTDVGISSTYRIPYPLIEETFSRLIDHLTNEDVTDIVVEIADGLLQQETSKLVRSEIFKTSVDGAIFAAADSMGAVGGSRLMSDIDVPLIGLSGVFTASPLAIKEVRANTNLPILTSAELTDGLIASQLLDNLPVVDLRELAGTNGQTKYPSPNGAK